MKGIKKTKLLERLRYIPLIFMGVFFVYFLFNFREISINNILTYAPSNYFLAAVIMISFFAIKSISIVIPLTILYVSSSIIFPWYWAIVVNIIGLFVSMTIPYYIGRFSGQESVDKLMAKYPKINKINDIKVKKQWIFVLIVKMLGFIPNDVSSIVLGSLNIEYKAFIISSMLAKTPTMLAKTLVVSNINKPGYKGYTAAILILILVFVFTVFVYWKSKKIEK